MKKPWRPLRNNLQRLISENRREQLEVAKKRLCDTINMIVGAFAHAINMGVLLI